MRADMKVTGLRELERELAKLPKGSDAKKIARRVLRREAAPVAAIANALSPFSDEKTIRHSTRARGGKFSSSEAGFFIGADLSKENGPLAHLLEFGTGPRYTANGAYRGSISPQPFMRPAWDARASGMIERIAADLWKELEVEMAK